MSTVFASDIHLSPNRGDISEAFIKFLQDKGAACQRLYLLGDIFEYWLGDDVSLADYEMECAALKALSDTGVELFFQVGNRDFALGNQFCQATGATLLPDPCVIEVNQNQVIIGHGDDLCTDDVGYQRLRKILRSKAFLAFATRWPSSLRRRFAAKLKQKSTSAQQYKSNQIMDVNPQAVMARFAELGADIMIHGHTHRPKHHIEQASNGPASNTPDSNPKHRIVLGDWYTQGSFLQIDATQSDVSGWALSTIPLATAD